MQVRRERRGAAYALQMHQEVVSKDGISRPKPFKGFKKEEGVKTEDALIELEQAALLERKS